MVEKKKGVKSLWIFLGVLAVLICAYVGIGKWQEHKEKKAQDKTKQTVLTEDKAWTKISYKTKDEELSFEKKDDSWYVEGDDTVKLTQSYVTAIADAFSGLTAVRELEGGDTLADYGLEEPAYTVTLTDADGAETVCYIGNAAGEDYYFTSGAKEKVYTVEGEAVQTLQHSLKDMISTEESGDTE